RTRAWWVLAAVAGAAACGGNVVVDSLSAGGSATTGSAGGVTTISGSTTSASSTTSTTGIASSSGSSGIPCVDSCPTGLSAGIVPCDGLPFKTYTALVMCACGSMGMCANDCDSNLCKFHTISAGCAACLPSGCPQELQECNAH